MLNVDTEQVKKSGYDIIKLSNDLNKIIDNLYFKIYNMPIVTKEWVGNSSEIFAKRANDVDKKDLLAFVNCLYKFGECLIDSAEKYELEIRNNN